MKRPNLKRINAQIFALEKLIAYLYSGGDGAFDELIVMAEVFDDEVAMWHEYRKWVVARFAR